MCGITGLWTKQTTPNVAEVLARMVETLFHRGPDDGGQWVDETGAFGLGFRRLAIIDLSEDGHQPMVSASGRTIMVFNGEVYNYRELRRALEAEGVRFRGASDSEVILESIERWGVEVAVPKLVGMFGIALWDVPNQRLTLVRDRLGIKPLFVYQYDGTVSFGSELKAMMAGPGFDRTMNPGALESYLRYLYVPAPQTIFRHAVKLMPGHILHISDPGQSLPPSQPYWDVRQVAAQGLSNPFLGSDDEAVTEMERLLAVVVQMRMHADVPLGALLSGGLDSSTVVALMQEAATEPVKTFTIGFDAREHNESVHAAEVARHLGTDHTELLVTGQEALDVIPSLPQMFDEPFADPSQVPTFLVSKLARSAVTVALSGDGADEVLGGYNRYITGARVLPRLDRVPAAVRRMLGAGVRRVSPQQWERMHRLVRPLLPGASRHRLPGDKMRKLGDLMAAPTMADMYQSLMSAWQHPEEIIDGNGRIPAPADVLLRTNTPPDFVDRAMLADQMNYLPDDLLAKVDRASMAVALEVRVPLIDHRVIELAWRLPQHLKIRNATSKWILRQVLYRRVPRPLVDRPKTGFTVPIDAWLRGPLREWAESLMLPGSLDDGPLRQKPVRQTWDAFQRGGSGGLGLWAVLMFEAWRKQWQVAGRETGPATSR